LYDETLPKKIYKQNTHLKRGREEQEMKINDLKRQHPRVQEHK
jgi:hypothetical protein